MQDHQLCGYWTLLWNFLYNVTPMHLGILGNFIKSKIFFFFYLYAVPFLLYITAILLPFH